MRICSKSLWSKMKGTFILISVILCWSVPTVLSCGGGSSSCTYTTCATHWSNWSPAVGHGSCLWQVKRASHSYTTHKRSGGCPGSTKCTTKDQSRYFCSCRVISQCRWGSWGPFQGSISRGTCGTQRRYRYAQKTWTYVNRVGSCSGTVTNCPSESDYQTRTWCNCRKAARCQPTNWSAWSGNVPDGSCRTQTSYRDFTPTYQYIEQQNNCHGIVSSCSSRQTNSRQYCMCPYYHCTLEDWTAWTLIAGSGTCPNEERFRNYRSTRLYKGAHSNCVGIGPNACPARKREERKKPVTCPALLTPTHGTLHGSGCDGASSSCSSTCSVSCDTDYPLQGAGYVVCQANGQWSGTLGQCIDSINPTITCPTIAAVPNTPNENYALVDLPDATANDNSGHVSVTVSHTSPLKVTVGTPVVVTYTATDAAGNTRRCNVNVEAKDTEAPKIIFCPTDKIIPTDTIPHTVIWKTPTATDNVDDASALQIVGSHQNGQKFSAGTHNIVFKIYDRSGNEAKCEFKIQISKMACPIYNAPKHGASTCNVKTMDVEEVFVCSTSCKPNYWFLQGDGIPAMYDFYICGKDGGWKGQNQFDITNPGGQMFVPIAKGSSPWPDCSEGKPPSQVKKPFKIVGGSCSAADVAKLKADVVAALMSDPVILNIFCVQNNQHCSIGNMKVSCSTVKKRSTGAASNQVHISFDFNVADNAPSGDQSTEMNKMTRIASSLGSLGREVKRVAASKLRTSTANVLLEEKAAKLSCEEGKTLTVVNGSGTTSDRTKCVNCPAGTKYVKDSQTCVVCPVGTYQELDGQSDCKKCQKGYSTHGYRASNYTACKEICPPGTYSNDGLATCLACPKGTYQPLANSTRCVSCPSGKGTAKEGSVVQSDCVTQTVQVKIKSVGCNDPTRARGSCGITTIEVNGVDHSTKRRGYNFVVLNEHTGAVEKSQYFDTHGDNSAQSRMKSFVDGLANGKVVLIGIQDEATARASYNYAYSSLISLGATYAKCQTRYRGSFAMLGYKGSPKPSWIKLLAPLPGQGPAVIETRIPLV